MSKSREELLTALRRKAMKLLKGSAPAPVLLKLRLTGSVADSWQTILDASKGSDLEDVQLFALLIASSARKVRTQLRKACPENG